MKFSTSIMAALIDGQPRRVGDMLPYLVKRVNPSVAVRCYQSSAYRRRIDSERSKRQRKERTVGEQIAIGARRTVMSSILSLIRKKYILVEKPEGATLMEDYIVRLSPERYKQLITMDRKRGSNAVSAWKELAHAVNMGWFKLSIEVKAVDDTPDCMAS